MLNAVQTSSGIVATGTPVTVRIAEKAAGRVGRPGIISMDLADTTSVEGTFVHLVGHAEIQGRSKKGKAIGLGVGLIPVLSLFSLFFLMTKGEDASVSPGFLIHGVVAPGK